MESKISNNGARLPAPLRLQSRSLCVILIALFSVAAFYSILRHNPGTRVVIAQSNPIPPCTDNAYGNQAASIQDAMLTGSETDVRDAIKLGKETRAERVGCAETCVLHPTPTPNFAVPALNAVATRWNDTHATAITNYAEACPAIGRKWGPVAIGGYYAKLAGYNADLAKLASIGEMYEGQQYKDSYVPGNAGEPEGLFGYYVVPLGNSCYPFGPNYGMGGGTDACGIPIPTPTATPVDPIQTLCDAKPSICVNYDAGPQSGKSFLIADIIPEVNHYDGGLAFDHAWAGVPMVEAKIQQPSQLLKEKFKQSAKLAADWAITEPPNRNHNYTAKLVWLLAEVYGLTGEIQYKDAMMDKFRRNLKHGILMPQAGNSLLVNDMFPAQAFADLTDLAQRKGRMWDGHNSRPPYQAMNTWAIVEAYVVLRDHGHTADAAELKPYALAMLDNLSWEVKNRGLPKEGKTQVPYALLLGLWKILGPEPSTPNDDWEGAVAAFWNAGMGLAAGDDTANVGLYLAYKAGLQYVPLRQRTEVYQPAAFSAISGSIVGGNLSSLYSDENNYLVLGNHADPTVSFEFHTTQTKITKLRVSLRSKDSASNGITRRLYIWNKTTSEWNPIGSDAIGITESPATVSQTSSGGFPQYVDNGVIKFALMHDGAAFHSMSIDWVELGVNEP